MSGPSCGALPEVEVLGDEVHIAREELDGACLADPLRPAAGAPIVEAPPDPAVDTPGPLANSQATSSNSAHCIIVTFTRQPLTHLRELMYMTRG